MQASLSQLANQVGVVLKAKKLLFTTAESCTGGMVATLITSVPGSASWFERGFVTYSNESKQELLDVKPEIIAQHGAASSETAQAMAIGALKNSHAEVSLAITGIAGPTGGSKEKPVGTVYFAWARSGKTLQAVEKHFTGDRDAVRQQATEYALTQLLTLI